MLIKQTSKTQNSFNTFPLPAQETLNFNKKCNFFPFFNIFFKFLKKVAQFCYEHISVNLIYILLKVNKLA